MKEMPRGGNQQVLLLALSSFLGHAKRFRDAHSVANVDHKKTISRKFRNWLNFGSLRSKRFRASSSIKLGRETRAKKRNEGGGGYSFFALVPIFSTNSRGNACYAG